MRSVDHFKSRGTPLKPKIGANVFERPRQCQKSSIFRASFTGRSGLRLENSQILLQHGADVNAPTSNLHGSTRALQAAAGTGSLELVKY